ncbi:Thiol-disulfide oxidoreductase YkuV [bacterium YEK0313]|nr:Thiol-disulfide oxidoreductase YkuV [bacterium YEK0313]
MSLFVLAFLAGALTVVTPCILPIVPVILARSGLPFVRGGLPMLLGLALAFAAIASLGAFAGGWAVAANRYGRAAALVLMAAFGLALVFPAVSARLSAPLVVAGGRLSAWAAGRRPTVLASAGLGVAAGLLWAPCAGPVLGLILSGAALAGPGLETAALLFTYGLGAAAALAIALLAGRRLAGVLRPSWSWLDGGRRLVGAAVVVAVALIGLGLDARLLQPLSARYAFGLENALARTLDTMREAGAAMAAPATPERLTGPLAALLGQTAWINAAPLGESDLRGKVVLVNFWTYSCINCLRALPHVKAWAEKYRDDGLIVIGVHTPEFAFEKDAGNVGSAATALGVRYPVLLDNEFQIWRAFRNAGWPGLYLVGSDGRMRHQMLGEGDYEQTERVIRRLLSEAGRPEAVGAAGPVTGEGVEREADWASLRSPETYLGYDKAERFAASGAVARDAPATYAHHRPLPLNTWSLAGGWTIGSEFASLNTDGGSIRYRFRARDLHLVLVPGAAGRPVRFRVTVDGAAPGEHHGADVDEAGHGVVTDGRLYQLVRQSGPVRERTFEIEFSGPGIRAYAFTFG